MYSKALKVAGWFARGKFSDLQTRARLVESDLKPQLDASSSLATSTTFRPIRSMAGHGFRKPETRVRFSHRAPFFVPVVEWLGSRLQNAPCWFDSSRGLHFP